LGRFWQEPESSQATDMALARCILGKFLGVVCQCFPLPLDVPTFAARCLYVPNNASAPSSERWNCGREWCPVILPKEEEEYDQFLIIFFLYYYFLILQYPDKICSALSLFSFFLSSSYFCFVFVFYRTHRYCIVPTHVGGIPHDDQMF
jgi:hypothetical protein